MFFILLPNIYLHFSHPLRALLKLVPAIALLRPLSCFHNVDLASPTCSGFHEGNIPALESYGGDEEAIQD